MISYIVREAQCACRHAGVQLQGRHSAGTRSTPDLSQETDPRTNHDNPTFTATADGWPIVSARVREPARAQARCGLFEPIKYAHAHACSSHGIGVRDSRMACSTMGVRMRSAHAHIRDRSWR
eukprot:2687436-Prymnesium_polylepis.4